MSKEPTFDKISFSVDLVKACRRELDFLDDVDRHRALTTDGPVVRRAIRRYETCWLPLAAGHQKDTLAPALDVHWVWHCHMLAPFSYAADVKRLVGIMVDHRLLSQADLKKARQKTRSLWTVAYPHEPFDVDLSSTTSDDCETTADYTPQCGYDVAAAIQRQSKFHYQVIVVVCTDITST